MSKNNPSEDMFKNFNPVLENAYYRHYKGGIYRVLCQASDYKSNLTNLVIKNIFTDSILTIPYKNFLEIVDLEKYPDADQEKCFELIENFDEILYMNSKTKENNSLTTPDNKTIYFAKCSKGAIIPTRKESDSGFDIYIDQSIESIIIEPSETRMVPTGLKSIIPNGYGMEIRERGSTGSLGIKSSAGIIDSSYRGEWFLAVTNTTAKTLYIKNSEVGIINEPDIIIYPKNKALFQACVYSTHNELNVKEVDECFIDENKTERGNGALGSSGK